MPNLVVKFVAANGALQTEKSIPVRNDNPLSYDQLTDILYTAGLAEYTARLDSGEFSVNGRNPRDERFSGRVEFKSTREEGIGAGPSTRVSAMAHGSGSGVCDIPSGSTLAAAFARAGVRVPAGSNIMMNGANATLTTRIPEGANVVIAAVGAVKGGC